MHIYHLSEHEGDHKGRTLHSDPLWGLFQYKVRDEAIG